MTWLSRLFRRRKPALKKVWPDDAQVSAAEADRRILRQLESLGADLSQPRHQGHYFAFPTEQLAGAARDRLTADGFTVDVRDTGEHGWVAMAEQTSIINRDVVDALRERLTRVGAELGGRYTGWEAAAKP